MSTAAVRALEIVDRAIEYAREAQQEASKNEKAIRAINRALIHLRNARDQIIDEIEGK